MLVEIFLICVAVCNRSCSLKLYRHQLIGFVTPALEIQRGLYKATRDTCTELVTQRAITLRKEANFAKTNMSPCIAPCSVYGEGWAFIDPFSLYPYCLLSRPRSPLECSARCPTASYGQLLYQTGLAGQNSRSAGTLQSL